MTNFLARVARLLLWLIFVSWTAAFLRRLIRSMLGDTATGAPPTADAAPAMAGTRRLVRDPLCGVHVDETLAIPFREESQLLHFCSTACRDRYAGNTRKFAANG